MQVLASREILKLLVEYQICQIEIEFQEVGDKINQLNEKIAVLNLKTDLSQSEKIELSYTQKDLDKLIGKLSKLNDKKMKLTNEI